MKPNFKRHFKLSQLASILGLSIVLTGFAGILVTWLAVDDELSELLYEDIQQQTQLLARLINQGHIAPDELKAFLGESFIDDAEDTFLISVEHLKEDWYTSNFGFPKSFGSTQTGLTQVFHQDHIWKGYQLREGDLLVKLLRRDDLAEDFKSDVTEDVIMPILIGNTLSILILLILLMVIVRPLSRLAGLLHQRDAKDLSALPQTSPVAELQDITNSLNHLIKGIEQTLNREKRFASDVAHELRTPLTTLKLELSLPDLDTQAMRQEVDRLIRVVEQLLTLARLEASNWQQHCETFNLKDPLQSLSHRLTSKFIAAGITFNSSLDDTLLQGDSTLLTLLVENLLLNALRHATGASQVTLTLVSKGKNWQLTVEDNGLGIPQDQQQRMMQPFTRQDQRSKGLGLGLSIVTQIAALHRLKIEMHNTTPGLSIKLQPITQLT
ncbi:MAG TPA: ATP-binding protein [Marinospirillum sp.]|uniref:ATP-binding protein n=1 Tax=Marinospirillum sp. TaxID=2183934 RepID=UPI002B47EACE|nr:ATP-binding protein [Marinospirillum sp.]HKM14704.1 ATP-binding protein [Marinospirillum sp.]